MGMKHKAVLELAAPVDPNHQGATKAGYTGDTLDIGKFVIVGDAEIQQDISVNFFMMSGQGSTLSAVTSSTINTVSDIIADNPAEAARAGFHLDLGGGKHRIQINFTGWEGAQADVDDDGSLEYLQWGNTGDETSVTAGDATGADPITQMNMLAQYIRLGEFDSRAVHGKLRFGEYSGGNDPYGGSYSDGVFPDDNYIHVVVDRLVADRTSEDPESWSGSLYLTETKNWTAPLDSVKDLEF